MPPLMSLEYDSDTDELLEELKSFFGVKSKSAVIRRSLALAKAAKRNANPESKAVTLGDPETEKTETMLLAG